MIIVVMFATTFVDKVSTQCVMSHGFVDDGVSLYVSDAVWGRAWRSKSPAAAVQSNEWIKAN